MSAAIPLERPAAPGRGDRGSNPFVTVGTVGRVSLIAFVVLYRLVTPGFQEIASPSDTPLVLPRLLAEWVHTFLLLAPLLFYQRSWGWLHPLIFPLAWSVVTSVGKDPDTLLAPFSIFSGPRELALTNPAMYGWSEMAVANAEFKATLLQILAISVYYVGFFLAPRLRVPRISFHPPRRPVPRLAAVVVLAVGVMVLFIAARGGLVRHILSLGMGRHTTLAGTGPIVVLAGVGTVAVLLWYSLVPRAAKNPLFWPGFLIALGSGFIMTGSRSSIAFTAIYFLMIWMLRHRRVPAVRAVAAGVAFFLLVGALGELRNSSRRGTTLDFSAFTNLDATRLAALSRESVGSRASGFVAVVGRAPDVGYLWGKSYLAAVFFWVPSAIWENKPRGAGGYAGDMLLSKGGGGVPVGPVGEAYWNFHIPGLILIFVFHGMFHRWLARTLRAYGDEPAVWPLYVLALMTLTPHTVQMISGIQMLVPALALLVWLRVFRLRPGRATRLGGMPAPAPLAAP